MTATVVTGALVLTGACARVPDDAGAVVVRDSAGIEIVENRGAPASSWTLSEIPLLDIGTAGGPSERQFHDVTAARRIGADRYLVANDGSLEIREYDARGELVRSFGGEGDGPGEFRAIGALILAGDTIIAYDRPLRRLTWFSRTGRFLASSTLRGPGLGPSGQPHRTADGSFVQAWVTSTALSRADSGLAATGEAVRGRLLLMRHEPTGQISDTLGTFPGNEEGLIESGGYAASTREPFGLGFSLATWAGRIVLGTQERFELRVYSGPVLERLIRAPEPDLLVSPERFNELIRRLVDQAPTPGVAEFVANSPEPRATRVPPFGRFLVASDGRLWVAEYTYWYLTARNWHVFDTDGSRIASVTVPERFRLLDAGSDYVLGVWRDDLDVEHVRVYGLSDGL